MSPANSDAGMPIAITLDAGTYERCTCGKSQNLPFCDGSHSGTTHQPLRFSLDRRQKVYLCSCGQSRRQPFCDESCGVALPKE